MKNIPVNSIGWFYLPGVFIGKPFCRVQVAGVTTVGTETVLNVVLLEAASTPSCKFEIGEALNIAACEFFAQLPN